MTWSDTFEITFHTDVVAFVVIVSTVTLLAPFLLGGIAGRRPARDGERPLLERLGLERVNPGLVLLAAILWLLIFGHLYLGLLWMIWEVWSGDESRSTEDWRFTLAKFAAMTAVLGAVVAFPITVIRLGLTRQQTRHAGDVLFNEKVNEAARSLYATKRISRRFHPVGERPQWRDMHEDDVTRRNAAIDALEALAGERPEQALRISRMLSVYARELSRELPAAPVPKGVDRFGLRHWALGLRPARSDLHTAVQALGRLRKRHAAVFEREREHIDLRGTNLQRMLLNADDLSYAGVRFGGAQMQGADLSGAQLREADLIGAQMQGANLIEAKLQGASLRWAELQGAFLTGAKLQGADLSWAELQGANLIEAKLQGASLRWAKLQGANLTLARFDTETVLQAARLRGACIRSVDLTGVALHQAQIDSLFGERTVTLPTDLTRPAHWLDIPEDDRDAFYTAWRAWQEQIGFDPDDPETW